MNFLIGLAVKVLEKLLAWLLKYIAKEIKEAKEIKDDNKKANENNQKYEEAKKKSPQERRDAAEDMLNGNN